MSHFVHAHLTVTTTRQTCRIVLMTISQSYPVHPPDMSHLLMTTSQSHPRVRHVAFCACPSYSHDHPSDMSHFTHEHLTVSSMRQACRILLMPISNEQSRPPARHVVFVQDYLTVSSTRQACEMLFMPIARYVTSTSLICRFLLMNISQ